MRWGTILGPKLCILYVNDICKVTNVLQFVIYADNTIIFCSGNKLNILLQDFTAELGRLKLWFDNNIHFLNVCTTNFILFGKRPTLPEMQVEESIDNIRLKGCLKLCFSG